MRVAIVGSGFSGSLLARVLRTQGHEVILVERGTHPRFAIGESTTPLANLSLERIARRYGLDDCYHLAAHGRWLARYPEIRRGLKRGFTFYRHHPGQRFANAGLASERLLVAASPDAAVSDVHWLRADVDHHFVREAVRAGVDYRERVDLTREGLRELRADFVIDASGPGGFLSRTLPIASALERAETRSALLFSHFDGVRLMPDVVPGLPPGPYGDDWAAVHHIVDGGWMYSLRFDHGVTSAGFALSPRGLSGFDPSDAASLWRALLARYPTIGALFGDARPLMPIAFRPRIQHRLTRAVGDGWLLMPHAFAFTDPLFSTGIAWSLRSVERLGLMFEHGLPSMADLERYERLLAREADQIDWLVAGAYEAMARFDLFAAQAMIYFATVSWAETQQRRVVADPWSGFLGVGEPVLDSLPREALGRLRRHDQHFVTWATAAIRARNVGNFGDPALHNLYPADPTLRSAPLDDPGVVLA